MPTSCIQTIVHTVSKVGQLLSVLNQEGVGFRARTMGPRCVGAVPNRNLGF